MQSKFDVPVRAKNTSIENDTGFTVLVRSPVEPGHASSHIERVTKAIDTYIGKLPGYISGALHIRADEKEFVNYTEWKSEVDYDGFIELIQKGEGHKKVKRDIGYEPKMIRYTHKETIHPNPKNAPIQDTGFREITRIAIKEHTPEDALRLWKNYVNDSLASSQGFISSSQHIKNDQTEIMCYTKWESESAFNSARVHSFECEGTEFITEKFNTR